MMSYEVKALQAELEKAREEIAAIEATDRRLIEENSRLREQIAAMREHLADIYKLSEDHTAAKMIARSALGTPASRRPEEENEAYRDAMTDAGRGHLLR